MDDWLSFTQIMGYIASALLISGYAFKSDVKTKIIITFSALCFVVHFSLLGAFTAAAMYVVNATRNTSSIFFHRSKKIFFVFVVMYVVGGIVTYNSLIDLLPIFSGLAACFAMFFLQGIQFRLFVILPTIPWIIHNIVVGSIGGTINSTIILLVSFITIMRLYAGKADTDETHR